MKKELLKDWFHYHLSARRGIIVLCLLLLFSIACKIYLPRWIKPDFQPLSVYALAISTLPEPSEKQELHEERFYAEEETNPALSEPFPFDPNTIDDDGWKKLGLSLGQIRSIRNYLHSGGRFNIKSDLSKMYVISPELFDRWKPFIQLPDELINPIKEYSEEVKPTNTKPMTSLNINTADSAELLNLPGIGPYYAGAIVRYRKKLGGYLNTSQLLEIWKMKSETMELIKDRIFVDQGDVKFISINSVSAEELSLHPYMNNTKARALISYREKHGPFTKPEDIRNCAVIDEATFTKIIAYIRL